MQNEFEMMFHKATKNIQPKCDVCGRFVGSYLEGYRAVYNDERDKVTFTHIACEEKDAG